MGGHIILSQKELYRINILQKVINKRMKQITASNLLHLSFRQTNRLVNNIKKHGIDSIAHSNRGKSSKRKFSKKFVDNIISIYTQLYYDFGPTFACEKLTDNHNITISSEALRNILISNNIPYPKRKTNRSNCHIWREPKEHFGEMILVDGSHHRWLEDRLDQEFCLMLYVDDATGHIWGKFYEYEGTFPCLHSLMLFVKKYGIPHSIYIDRHSTYFTTRDTSTEEDLRALKPDTQFARVVKSIGTELIFANSPQAKGRVERQFGTLQDRLVKEMRLLNVSSIDKANEFLEQYLSVFNKKFSRSAKANSSLFTPVKKDFDYKWTFAIKHDRVIHNDYTIRWKNRLFVINNPSISLKRKKVEIKLSLDGEMFFTTKTKRLRTNEITDKDLELAKKNKKMLLRIAKQYSYNKAKKSYYDHLAYCNSPNFYNSFKT
ncbi:ISNCY family transposase [bacterium]